MQFNLFINVFAFLYLEVNFKEMCEEMSFSLFFFFRKMLISAFLLSGFKANYLENMPGYPHFSLWIQSLQRSTFPAWS